MPRTTRPRGGRPKYTPEQRANALATLERNGGNAKKTARDLGVPRTTLRHIAGRATDSVRGVLHKDAPPDLRAELLGKWDNIASKATSIVQTALDGLEPSELKVHEIERVNLIAAVATDKGQVLRGGVTSRVGFEPLAVFFSSALRTPEPQAAIEGSYRVEDQDKAPAPVEKRDKPA